MWSHPLRVRGLKLVQVKVHCIINESHPLRVRGLKHFRVYFIATYHMSHPLRVRGLKQLITVAATPLPRRILYGCVD